MTTQTLENNEIDQRISHYQHKLLPYAYNILGDYLSAEDIVQEVLNKHFITSHEHIISEEYYLVKSVINNAINQKNLLRNRMEDYRGQWLPTPIVTEETIYDHADQTKILQFSLLVLLEKLSPKERAVFILKESFDYSHAEIGDILDIATENSRQLLKRSREKISTEQKQRTVPTNHHHTIEQLTSAILNRDTEKVKMVLNEDIKLTSDGGSVRAAQNILEGTESIFKFLSAIYGKYLPENSTSVFKIINHQPALIFSTNGQVYRTMVFEFAGSKISNIYITVNPEKLKNIKF